MNRLKLKVLIADDDEGMRLILRKIVSRAEGYEIAGEAEDGQAALRLYEAVRPDVVFLDVEMPVVNGVECAKRIADINPKTLIIFATAHEEYMPEAFSVYAFDYVVKPFKAERLLKTLERIIEAEGIKMEFAAGKRQATSIASEKLMVRNKEEINLIDVSEILLIQREDRTTAIYTGNERFVTSEGLSELEERLDKSIFFRSHKSYIINLGAINKIYPYGRWTYVVKLKGTDKDALLTHERYEELEKLFR